jgi:hypothetical protein
VEPFEVLERSLGIPIPMRAVLFNPLVHYVEGLNGTHALLALGAGMLLNHAPRHAANVRKVMLYADGLWRFRAPFQRSIDFLHEYSAYVAEGDEFLVDYGDDWFEDRGLSAAPLEPERRAASVAVAADGRLSPSGDDDGDDGDDDGTDAQEERWLRATGCGDFWMAVDASRGAVVARRDVAAGTALETSRALLLPLTGPLLTSGPLEEVVWWLSEEPRDVGAALQHPPSPYAVPPFGALQREHALLLSGKSALLGASVDCSDSNEQADAAANVQLRFVGPPVCGHRMAVQTVAVRDVRAGEELRVAACRRQDSHRKLLRGRAAEGLAHCLSVQLP